MRGPMDRKYKADSFNFAALHVIPVNVWFIIPMAIIKVGTYVIPGKQDSKYYQYEEAWHLLKPEQR